MSWEAHTRLKRQFEHDYAAMQAAFPSHMVPPSRELIVEATRRTGMPVLHVIAYWRRHWRGPQVSK